MNTTELNNRKYTLITEITRIESEEVIRKIEKLLDKESLTEKKIKKKSPLAFSVDELKLEIEEAEKETGFYTQDQVRTMSWEK